MPPIDIEKNVARLMIRRHNPRWLKLGISEDLLATYYVETMHRFPDLPMKGVSEVMDRMLRIALERDRQRRLKLRAQQP